MSNLMERGFVQGSSVNCENYIHLTDLMNAVKNGRSIPEKRSKQITKKHLLIVLSQDCDISNSQEHYIEVATAKRIRSNKNNPVLENTRSTNKLHLDVNQSKLEIESSLISTIPKNIIENNLSIQPYGRIQGDSKDILIQWRINRYAREPFPDSFNQSLIQNYLRKPKTGFEKLFLENRDKISNIFAYVVPSDDDNASEYLVSLTLVLTIDCDQSDVRDLRTKFMPHIQTLNKIDNKLRMLQVDGEAEQHESLTNPALVCLPSDFTFEDANCMRRLTLDFLCWD